MPEQGPQCEPSVPNVPSTSQTDATTKAEGTMASDSPVEELREGVPPQAHPSDGGETHKVHLQCEQGDAGRQSQCELGAGTPASSAGAEAAIVEDKSGKTKWRQHRKEGATQAEPDKSKPHDDDNHTVPIQATGGKELARLVKVGAEVVVMKAFVSQNEQRHKLEKGLRGRIHKIDEEFDAMVLFPGLDTTTQWVYHEDLLNLGFLPSPPEEDMT